jgi:CxxC-x17-CxxC domain-containing protein
MAEKVTIIGQTNFRGQKRKFGIYTDDRRRHVYVIGKTGVGKTTLLETMITQDIMDGHGLGVVDPHGDMAERLLDVIPPSRINDVVYFDPSDVNYPIGFNPLEAVDPQYKYLVASGLVSSLKKIWADSWGPRLEYILRNTILALLDYPSSTMLGIMRLLSDKEYRKKVVSKISDPVIKSFWTNEFANYNERFRSEAISPIQNKVGQFLSSAVIRNIVAQPKSTIDIRDIMDNGKIWIMNVSKGKIGEDNSALLGAMLITKIQLTAMDRAKIPEENRRDFYLYVDEFQNFATESFATILSEARKYRLNLTIAHQYITQMEEKVRDAVFGNVGTIAAFRVGALDAEYLEKEYMPIFTQTDLVNLPKYNAYIKLMIGGITSRPFSMETVLPPIEKTGKRDTVLRVSRERYGQEKAIVEDKIVRWSGLAFKGAAEGEFSLPPLMDDNRPRDRRTPPSLTDVVLESPQAEIKNLEVALRSSPKRETYAVTCSRCGKATEVPFKPTAGRPVYCRECLEKVRQEGKKITPPARDTTRFSGPPPPARPRQ